MSNFKQKFWDPLYKFCTSYILYIFALFSIIFISTAYLVFDKQDIWHDVFKTIGFTLFSGGVFAVIVKSEQFSKIFQNELRDIVYSDECLEKRNDLDKIWEKVSLALCNQKFKTVSKKLHEKIKQFYLPIKEEYYYKNYSVDLTIDLDKENEDFVTITEVNTTQIISDDLKTKIYDFKSTIPKLDENDQLTSYKLIEFVVNDEKKDVSKVENLSNDKNLIYYFKHECNGSTIYNITRKEQKRYSLKSNPYRIHLAAWLIDTFSLEVHYDKNLEITFIEMGLVDSFKHTPMNTNHYKRFKAVYNGLIFRKQGHMLYFKKN